MVCQVIYCGVRLKGATGNEQWLELGYALKRA